jgi:small subunit ribosomal protein S20
MPITRSAAKALRQNRKNRSRNLARAKAMKEAVKAIRKSPSRDLLSAAFQAIDKASKGNVIQANRAGRMKSQLAKLVK